MTRVDANFKRASDVIDNLVPPKMQTFISVVAIHIYCIDESLVPIVVACKHGSW